jgi:hypothetical protein
VGRTTKEDDGGGTQVATSVNGGRVIPNKWLMITAVHEVVGPDCPLARSDIGLTSAMVTTSVLKLKRRSQHADRQIYRCLLEIGPESQLSGKEVTSDEENWTWS